jgi:hypothetical protein
MRDLALITLGVIKIVSAQCLYEVDHVGSQPHVLIYVIDSRLTSD